MRTELTHIALHVSDLEASMDFYQDLAGMDDITPLEDQHSRWLMSPKNADGSEQMGLVLVDGSPEKEVVPTDVTRLGFSVGTKGQLKEIYTKAVQDKRVVEDYEESADGQTASFRMTDPTGHVLEFWTSEHASDGVNFANMTLHVEDMEKTRDFYESWTDMEFLRYGQTGHSLRLGNSSHDKPFNLVLCESECEATVSSEEDIGHLGFAVDSAQALREVYERAQNEADIIFDWVEMSPPVGTLFMIGDPDQAKVEFSYGQPLGSFKQTI